MSTWPPSLWRDPAAAPPVPKARIAELCQAAQAYVARATSVPIDTSEESLAFVDHYLRGAQKVAGGVSDEVVALIAAALGAHLGEVAIARFGGEWRALPPGSAEDGADVGDPQRWRVLLAAAPLCFDPVGMAAEGLRLGSVEGYDAGLAARPDLAPALIEALERLPPVSEEDYYSLTGRLESLAYAVELVLAIEHAPDQPDDGARPADA